MRVVRIEVLLHVHDARGTIRGTEHDARGTIPTGRTTAFEAVLVLGLTHPSR